MVHCFRCYRTWSTVSGVTYRTWSTVSGVTEHGPLCGLVQPHKAAGAVPAVGGPHHGGVLPAGGQGAGGRPGHLTHVRQVQRHHRKVPGERETETCCSIEEESDRREGMGDIIDSIPCRASYFAPGWFGEIRVDERTHGKMDDHPVYTTPNHRPPKMDVLVKAFLKIILAAKRLVWHSSTCRNSIDDLCLLLCLLLLLCVVLFSRICSHMGMVADLDLHPIP